MFTMSKKRADAISNGIFLISLGILAFADFWWPGILLAIWISLAIRQCFTGRFYDLIISTIILLGLFTVSILKLDWSVLVPVLLIVGGIYIIFREYSVAAGFEDDDPIDESEREIEEKEEEKNGRSKKNKG
jgi:hypothetical protein